MGPGAATGAGRSYRRPQGRGTATAPEAAPSRYQGSRLTLGHESLAQGGAGAGQEAGDVHLGEAELLADLGLRHFRSEAHPEKGAFAVIELGQMRLECLDVFGQGEGGVLAADEVGDKAGLLLAAGLDGPVYGVAVVAVAGHEPLRHLVLLDVEMGGEVGGGRLVAALVLQLFPGTCEVDTQFLKAPGNPHRPSGVAEEPLDLTLDVGDGQRGELHVAGGVIAVDGLDQTDRPDLEDVLHGLPPAGEAAGDVAHQGEVHLDEGVPRVLVLGGPLLQLLEPQKELLGQLPCVGRGNALRNLDLWQHRRSRNGTPVDVVSGSVPTVKVLLLLMLWLPPVAEPRRTLPYPPLPQACPVVSR